MHTCLRPSLNTACEAQLSLKASLSQNVYRLKGFRGRSQMHRDASRDRHESKARMDLPPENRNLAWRRRRSK